MRYENMLNIFHYNRTTYSITAFLMRIAHLRLPQYTKLPSAKAEIQRNTGDIQQSD